MADLGSALGSFMSGAFSGAATGMAINNMKEKRKEKAQEDSVKPVGDMVTAGEPAGAMPALAPTSTVGAGGGKPAPVGTPITGFGAEAGTQTAAAGPVIGRKVGTGSFWDDVQSNQMES